MARPLQNRVDPFGAFHAVPERGLFMGGRGGKLHRDDRTLGPKLWAGKRWLVCLSAFKGRRREVWGAGYTELFFLDEPTALAAGHRPCFECRRAAARAFFAAFPGAPQDADALDAMLHRERLDGRGKRRHPARAGALPEGAFFARGEKAFAVRGGRALPWSFAGYGPPEPIEADERVDTLTPPATVAALAAGYRPQWAA